MALFTLTVIKRALRHRTTQLLLDSNSEVNPTTWRGLRIDRQPPTYLQLQLDTQTNPITPQHIGTCEGQTTNTEATERDVHDTMFRMFQLLRGLNWSAIRYTYEGT